MNHSPDSIVLTVQSAFLELLELVGKVTQGDNPEKQETFREEAEKTVLMFIATIIVASREYKPTERSFITLLVNCQDKPGGEVRYLNEYAARWAEASKRIPQFFATAIQYDSMHATNIAREMMCQIQLIGNNTCVSDGNSCGARREIVKNHLALLETFIAMSMVPSICERDFSNGLTSKELAISDSPVQQNDNPLLRPVETQPSAIQTPKASEFGNGSVGYFGLTRWWLTEFSDEQRAYIASRYSGKEAETITKGTIKPHERGGFGFVQHSNGLGFTLGTCANFLMGMASRLNCRTDYALSVKIIKKLVDQVEIGGTDPIDKHHAFGWMVKRFFKEQEFDQHAAQRTTWACVKQIEIAPQVQKLVRIANGWGTVIDMPKRHITILHEGYSRLAILLEKEKKYGEVVALCEQALQQGWVGTDWKTKLLKCKVYAAAEEPPIKILPDLPELVWDDTLTLETQTVPAFPIETTLCPIPIYDQCFTNGVPNEMDSEQRAFYRKLSESIKDRTYLSVHGQSAYLNFYIRDNFRTFDNNTLEHLYDELLRLGEAYKSEVGNYWRPVEWSYDCLIALESYERFFEVTKPINIFSGRTHFANFKCNVRNYLGLPASGIDFLQMYGARTTKITKQHPQEFGKYVEAVFMDEQKMNGSWFDPILAGSDRKDYENHLFHMLHFARRSKIPNYCFYQCSDFVKKRISGAFREAENRLRQDLGEKNVGEQWADETELFYAIKKAFPEFEVVHHGRPEWLGQLHLDVWIPDLKIAIEYHGPQHFEAMEHYGGVAALEATKKRDVLKRLACEREGVRLFEVISLDQLSLIINDIKEIAPSA